MKALKIIGVLLSLFFTMMLFIFLVRMFNNKEPFVSVRVLWNAISQIDLLEPWTKLEITFQDLVGSFQKVSYLKENVSELEQFWNVLTNLGNAIWTFLKFPVEILLAIANFIYSILSAISNFFIVVLQ